MGYGQIRCLLGTWKTVKNITFPLFEVVVDDDPVVCGDAERRHEECLAVLVERAVWQRSVF